MRGQGLQNVTIKGTKDGLTLHLNDQCSYQELLDELQDKLSNTPVEMDTSLLVDVKLKTSMRYLSEEQEEELKELVRREKNLVVTAIESDVMTKKQALKWQEQQSIERLRQMVRSGQVVEVPGDLLLVGDVNPGGTVRAGGSIYVMGALKGTAIAGAEGDNKAVICASVMQPMQLRIADVISRAPDERSEGRGMECAYLNEEQTHIVLDRLQHLAQPRQNLIK
ncbi:septum site-determining protein MinC [Aureibacillus halotolerans]|uniref:Probable septum site-determining protein MinC n=1 Tax=Aureibacillus halotolerans TaxID=1508390 RepID=A0A4R6TZZ1_9BACI|nr:septum site-determining protein MinC [Aureibacillus halotolerans]TDQ37963.1 septum site-determining protein MinC [Aureibacillus halotolerans]